MRKGPLWDGRTTSTTNYSLIAIRDKADHLQRRKYWNKGLNTSSIKEYEPILKIRVEQLVDLLKKKAFENARVDIEEWMSFFAFDFMCDMAFGEGFQLMRDGDSKQLWKLMDDGLRTQSYSQHVPWARSMTMNFPPTGKPLADLRSFAIQHGQKRLERGPLANTSDLSSHLLGEKEKSSMKPLPTEDYISDAFLVIVAGSDTTATTLSSIFFHLISHPKILERLQDEVEEYYPKDEGILPMDDMSRLVDMPLLNGVINEALRLTPAVPTGLQRDLDERNVGKVVGSTYIPPGTSVSIPPFAIHRDDRYFSPDPDSFHPDRWIETGSSVETNRTAFIPFSVGPMNCVGKQLAQLELRVVVSSLVREVEMTFQVGWDTKEWEHELEDEYVFKKGKVPVILALRNRSV